MSYDDLEELIDYIEEHQPTEEELAALKEAEEAEEIEDMDSLLEAAKEAVYSMLSSCLVSINHSEVASSNSYAFWVTIREALPPGRAIATKLYVPKAQLKERREDLMQRIGFIAARQFLDKFGK